MICRKCKAVLPDGTRFCGQCGSPVSEAFYCPKCGSQVLPENRFCVRCGEVVSMVNASETSDLYPSRPQADSVPLMKPQPDTAPTYQNLTMPFSTVTAVL